MDHSTQGFGPALAEGLNGEWDGDNACVRLADGARITVSFTGRVTYLADGGGGWLVRIEVGRFSEGLATLTERAERIVRGER